ncbi:DUF1488 domain-containing protein [Parasalinivibrio latis]|uniref:DUF1488 domain-containing protein n=1 Tax=Parasalinivibrio latis TaxID=2952610 RepID=UPI0030DE04A6
MNQNILFPDVQTWHAEQGQVEFPAQQAGALITCFVSKQWLETAIGHSLDDETAVLAAFANCRFDLEDIAEGAIEDENFNTEGCIEIR